MRDSTAGLVGSHVPHVELSFHLFPVGKRGMKKNNPIPGHPQPHLRLILARSHFLRLPEHGAHARVRHICLKRNAGSCDRLRRGIRQLQSDRNRADPGWLGRDGVRNCDHGRRFASPGTAGPEQSGNQGRGQKISTCPHRQAGYRPGPSNGTHRCTSPSGLQRRPGPRCVRQLSLSCHCPMRKCSSSFPARPRAGTCDSTCRSPWG